jgi:hypothetical protein
LDFVETSCWEKDSDCSQKLQARAPFGSIEPH